ncbi:MAG: ABC transporter permease [Desulfobacterota bacterium]|nr:ABC transporter permease [Thermodesulfobacteriota bacterium]
MTIVHIACKNLLRKKVRSLLTMFGIALSAWVLISLFGFNAGYESSLNRDIDSLGYQVLVTAKGCPYEAATLMLKGGTGLRYMPQRIADAIAQESEVEAVTAMLMHTVFDPNKGESGGYSAYLGVDPTTFPKMKPFMEFMHGGWFTQPDALEAVLGYEAAELEQREVGDLLLITEKNIEVKVVGVLKRTGTQDDGTIFLPLRTVQQIFGVTDVLTGIGVKLKHEADITRFEEKMYRLPDVQVVTMSQVKQTIMTLVTTAKVIVLSIALIAVLISMTGVMNTVLMSVMERRQELGILKALGATSLDIFMLIWLETFVLCVLGSCFGAVVAVTTSALTDMLVRNILPYAPRGGLMQISMPLVVMTVGTVTGIGLVSGIYPSWQAGRVRPLDAIRSQEE